MLVCLGASFVSETSANTVSILPLVFFILLRVRFPLAVGLSALNVVVFSAYWRVVLCSSSGDECKMDAQIFSQVVSVTSLIALVSGYGGYMRERALRRDFLLQQQVNPGPSLHLSRSPSLSPSPHPRPFQRPNPVPHPQPKANPNQLRDKREVSKAILDNMLPPHITERLASSPPGTIVADTEPAVSVLFADIQDFASIVSKLTPVELVTLLDKVRPQPERRPTLAPS